MPVNLPTTFGKADYNVVLALQRLAEQSNTLERLLASLQNRGLPLAELQTELQRLTERVNAIARQVADDGGGAGTVVVDPAGALDGDGSAGSPLAVRPDGVTVIINGSNELEAPGAAGGITELTGDVAAGPGSGSQAATLANSGVGAGSYGDATTVPAFTVDAKGRVTAAVDVPISFPPSTGITELTGDVTAGPGSGSQAATIGARKVLYSMMPSVTAARLLGRGNGAGAGDAQEIDFGPGLTFVGTTMALDVPGSDGQIMYRKASALAGDAGLTYDDATNRLTIDLLTLLGGQILFPATQNASTNGNTLDDFEKGVWTPVDNSGASLSFSAAAGVYVKIGPLIAATLDVTYPATANGSQVRISLPFSAEGTLMANGYGSMMGYTNCSVATVTPLASGASAFGYRNNDGSSLTNANMSNANIRFTCLYRGVT